MCKNQVPVDVLNELVQFDVETGKLYWRPRSDRWFSSKKQCARWNTRYAGKEAFAVVNHDGYLVGRMLKRAFMAHRVAFALHHGRWPGEVDHKDNDKANNRPGNLRESAHRQNMHNFGGFEGSSRFKGVSRHGDQWRARANGTDGETHHLGYFSDEEAAARAYDAFARQHHGDFARLNLSEGT